MTTSKLWAIAGAAISVAGCAGHDDKEATATVTAALEVSPPDVTPTKVPDVYVTVESTEPCTTSACSGAEWVVELNRADGPRQVSRLDYSELGRGAIDQAAGAGKGELVLLGRFEPPDKGASIGPFDVLGAWRALPDVTPSRFDRTFALETIDDRSVASLLNGDWGQPIETVSVSGIVLPMVDSAWLLSRVLGHGALVAGHFDGEKTLEAGQVYVRLPDIVGPCPLLRMYCGDLTATYERNDDRCLMPTGCAVRRDCPQIVPVCEPGYVLASWPSQPRACPAYACDPAFIDQ